MRKTVLAVINYICCIGMALFVTFVVDGTIGMVLTYALIAAPVVSLIMTLAVFRSITVQPVLSHSAVSKGDRLSLDVKLSDRVFLPTPIIEVETDASAHLRFDGEKTLKGTVTGRGVNLLKFPLTAVHSGKAHISVKSVTLSDFLGIFTFRLKLTNEPSDLTVAVFPDIPEASVQTNTLRTSSRFMSDEDDEEESEESSPVPTGLAGYDHREYAAGDPIKRINWKASSKRDILLVRLDEKIKGSGRTFLLDCPVTQEDDVSLTVRDNVIEGALAMLISLLQEGRDAVFYYCKQGLWMSADIRSEADVYKLREELSDFEACDTTQVIPPEPDGSSRAVICFTGAMKGNADSARFIVSKRPDTMLITSYASSLPVICSNQWTLSDSFELSRM